MKRIITTAALSLLCLCAFCQPALVAHRGCRNVPGVDENTIAALKYAQNVPVDFVEFDVHLTSDNKVIVFHGAKVPGIGKDIRNMTFAEARAVVLPGGGRMPTLKEWFAQVRKHPEIKVIMELKSNFSKERDLLLVRLAMEEVKARKMEKYVDYTTFNKDMCEEIHRINPAAKVLFLQSGTNPMKAEEAAKLGYNGISYNVKTWYSDQSIIAKAKELGIETTLWIANEKEVIDWAVEHHIDCISVDDPAKVRPYLNSLKR